MDSTGYGPWMIASGRKPRRRNDSHGQQLQAGHQGNQYVSYSSSKKHQGTSTELVTPSQNKFHLLDDTRDLESNFSRQTESQPSCNPVQVSGVERPLNHHDKSSSSSDMSQTAGNASQQWRFKAGKPNKSKQLTPVNSGTTYTDDSRYDKAGKTFEFSSQKPSSPSQHHSGKSLDSPQPLFSRLTTTLGGNMDCDKIGDKENSATASHKEPLPVSNSITLAAPPTRSCSTGAMAKLQNKIQLKTIVRGQHSGIIPSSNVEQSSKPKRPKRSLEDRDTFLPTLNFLNTCLERVQTTDMDSSHRDGGFGLCGIKKTSTFKQFQGLDGLYTLSFLLQL
ncbi:hypothetical protein C5167_008650 [Papaver somniferum]|uniref:Uncharacterized protein n=1 Tax=Papaver somniferum TaxID=3469 RepID=A0A4Y7JYA0_PAPSO|nr:hypothetical protein C5167_008650 [Papaver somniferum]